MFAWITLLLVVISLGLEVFFLRIGYFRTVHWESLALLACACLTAALGFRQRKGVLSFSTFLLTILITVGMAYLTIWVPRLPVKDAAFEQPGAQVELVLRSPDDRPVLLPAEMERDHALLVFYRGLW